MLFEVPPCRESSDKGGAPPVTLHSFPPCRKKSATRVGQPRDDLSRHSPTHHIRQSFPTRPIEPIISDLAHQLNHVLKTRAGSMEATLRNEIIAAPKQRKSAPTKTIT